MRVKSILISLLIIITGAMSIILSKLLRLYRVHVFIDADSSAKDIVKFQAIIRYQNIIWGFIVVIILGLIILICIENKKKIVTLFKKLYN